MALMNRIKDVKPKHVTTEEKKKEKMGFKGKMMDFAANVGLVKPTKATVRQEQEYISAVVAESVNLSDRLGAIRCRSNSEEITLEDVDKHKKIIALLRAKLNDLSMGASPDTRKLDALLYILCDRLQEAYDNGDKLSATCILDTLNFGILQGHKPLLEEEKGSAAKVMQQRMEKLESYLKICDAAKDMHALRDSIMKEAEKIEKGLAARKQYRKDVKTFEQASGENMAAVKEVRQAGGNLKDLKGAALTYATLLRKFALKHKEVEDLRKTMALNEASMQDLSSMITAIQNELDAPIQEYTQELMEYLKGLSQEKLVRLDKQFENMKETRELLNTYFKAVDAVFQQPAMQEYLVGAFDEYERITHMLDEEEAEYARAGSSGITQQKPQEELFN